MLLARMKSLASVWHTVSDKKAIFIDKMIQTKHMGGQGKAGL